ncbi:MAG: hypothetical protein M0P57_01735 [Syntrophales bacterium]|jgi:hypothetical protein|nr:hypothetical protein [Syntrophales bacterium]MDY0045731.1 hypothetical protein [Syntrophales bacterium]
MEERIEDFESVGSVTGIQDGYSHIVNELCAAGDLLRAASGSITHLCRADNNIVETETPERCSAYDSPGVFLFYNKYPAMLCFVRFYHPLRGVLYVRPFKMEYN